MLDVSKNCQKSPNNDLKAREKKDRQIQEKLKTNTIKNPNLSHLKVPLMDRDPALSGSVNQKEPQTKSTLEKGQFMDRNWALLGS